MGDVLFVALTIALSRCSRWSCAGPRSCERPEMIAANIVVAQRVGASAPVVLGVIQLKDIVKQGHG